MRVDDEAAGVVVARDPGAAVDVDGGGGGAVEGGRLGDAGLLVVAIGDRRPAGRRSAVRGRRRRADPAPAPERVAGSRRWRRSDGRGRARGASRQAPAPPHGPQCWSIGTPRRPRPRPAATSPGPPGGRCLAPDLIRRQNCAPYAQRRDRRRRPHPGRPPGRPPLGVARHRPGRPAAGRPAGPQRPGPLPGRGRGHGLHHDGRASRP